ncbi:uncharacterized protein METZ01_LOCUS310515, partial [marine metagenome]
VTSPPDSSATRRTMSRPRPLLTLDDPRSNTSVDGRPSPSSVMVRRGGPEVTDTVNPTPATVWVSTFCTRLSSTLSTSAADRLTSTGVVSSTSAATVRCWAEATTLQNPMRWVTTAGRSQMVDSADSVRRTSSMSAVTSLSRWTMSPI